jgi:hypothetical protein
MSKALKFMMNEKNLKKNTILNNLKSIHGSYKVLHKLNNWD